MVIRNPVDIFQFHSDWVCFQDGRHIILTHVPLISPTTKMKLYKYLPTPLADIIEGGTHLILDSDEHYLAVNEDGTIYAKLNDWQLSNNCYMVEDIRVCKELNIL